jgi:branched-chain amino acid transport system substrate-binding protein
VKIAVLQDLSVDGAPQLVTPAFLGLRLALETAADRGGLPVVPEVVSIDTQGDPSRALELAHEVAADPSYVAAVVAPFWSETPAVGDALDAAGVPTISLSGLDPSPVDRGRSTWRRVVADLPREGASLASAISGSPTSAAGVCLAGDGSSYATDLAAILKATMGAGAVVAEITVATEADVSAAVVRIGRAGCGAVAWTGFASGATLLRTRLMEAGLERIPLLGSAAMKADAYLSTTAGAGDGTVVTCACVDLGSSTRAEAQRFIHDYQSQYGTPPGPFAAEAWDVGGMLLRAFGAGAATRQAVAGELGRVATFRGLANTYRFAADGDLTGGSARIHTFRAEGLRWVPQGETDSQAELPVGTPGYLSVASCRKGSPFAYTARGRLRGFDVELAQAVARKLGLRLAWSHRPCRAGLRAVAAGTLDALLAPANEIPQGSPTSSVALALHVGLVGPRSAAHGDRPLLKRLGPDDVVGVVRTPETVAWARTAIPPTGASFLVLGDRAHAYDGLVAGRFAAVADLEPDAWAAIERRPTLAVVQSIDAGDRDVFVAKGPDAVLVAAIDRALGRLLDEGRYTLLFAKYFPGTPIPKETGT